MRRSSSSAPGRVLDSAQVAKALRITVDTARLRLASGALRGAFIERRQWRIRRSDLLAYMTSELRVHAGRSVAEHMKEGA